jgi:hypothetical protein
MYHRNCLLVLLICLTCCTANSQATQSFRPAAIKAPVGCKDAGPIAASCGEDISLSDAQISRRATSPRAKSMVLTDQCGESSVIGFYYFWAPENELPDGEDNFRQLTKRLREGVIRNRIAIVQAAKSPAGEQHIARCDVVTVGAVSGPPRNCTTVAIVTRDKTWLRAAVPRDICLAAGEFRPSGAIDITFEIKTTIRAPEIASSIVRALENQFGLSASQQSNKTRDGSIAQAYIQSASALRDSKILTGGWREALDFDLGVEQHEQRVGVHGTAHVMVSRQAVSQLTEYTGLSDSQRGIYLNALNDGIEQALLQVNTSCRRIDARNITCQ